MMGFHLPALELVATGAKNLLPPRCRIPHAGNSNLSMLPYSERLPIARVVKTARLYIPLS